MINKLSLPNNFLAIAEEELRQGHSVKLLVKGNSMLPFICGGKDISEIEPFTPDKPVKLWEVYLFKWHDEYTIHRFVGYREDNLLMLGDGNLLRFEKVKRNDIIGRLTKIHKPSGKVIDTTTSLWLFKGKIWYRLLKFRPYLLRIIRIIGHRSSIQ